MQTSACRFLPLAIALLLGGCATRQLPKYEKPIARAQHQHVRTTAYTHTESDHRRYSNRNALGSRLLSGPVKSAACDWSRWPVGTVFRIQETGETYEVDDYGWALAGTNTIDLYKPSRSAMNRWGVRRVNIEILEWGDARRSLAILTPRAKHAHVKRMVADLRRRFDELTEPMMLATTTPESTEPGLVAAAVEAEAPRAVAVASVRSEPRVGGFTTASGSRPVLTPFHAAGER